MIRMRRLTESPKRDSIFQLGDFITDACKDPVTWMDMIGRNVLFGLNLSGVMLLDFCASYSLSIMNAMSVHKCMWKQDTPGTVQ